MLIQTAVRWFQSHFRILFARNIPRGLKSIENHAFTDYVSLIKLSLPDGVKKIGKEAFAGCKKLELYVPPTLKSIGKNAFGSTKTGKIKMLYCIKNSAAYKYARKYGGKAVVTITSAQNKKMMAKMTVRVEKHVFRLIRNNKAFKLFKRQYCGL